MKMSDEQKHRSKEASLIIKDWLSLYPQDWNRKQKLAIQKLVTHTLKKRDLRWENILRSQGYDIEVIY